MLLLLLCVCLFVCFSLFLITSFTSTCFVQIKGSGATRTVSLVSPHCIPLLSSSLAAPPDQHVVDGILALLISTNLYKLSVIELTKKYNTTFRKSMDQLSEKKLLDVVNASPNFKVIVC